MNDLTNDLMLFDPKFFIQINQIEYQFLNFPVSDKKKLYQYYLQHKYLLSNLNIFPKYRHVSLETTLLSSLTHYKQHIQPVNSRNEMYRDFINRLQYTTLIPVIVDLYPDWEAIRLFYQCSFLSQLERTTLIKIRRYPDCFFQYLAVKYFSTTYFRQLKDLYEHLLNDEQYELMMVKIHQVLENLLNEKKYLLNHVPIIPKTNEQILLIKCYQSSLIGLTDYLVNYYQNNYLILLDYPFLSGEWPQSWRQYLHIYHQLQPDVILYLDQLNKLPSIIVADRELYPNCQQWYYINNCQQLELHYLPLIRSLYLIYNNQRERTNLGLNNSNTILTTSIVNNQSTISESSLIVKEYTYFYTFDEEITIIDFNQPEIIELAIRNSIRFILPNSESNFQTYQLSKIISLVSFIKLSDLQQHRLIYFTTRFCLQRFILNKAIQYKHLLLLPQNNCLKSKTLSCFYYSDNNSFCHNINSMIGILKNKNLENSKKLNQLYHSNLIQIQKDC